MKGGCAVYPCVIRIAICVSAFVILRPEYLSFHVPPFCHFTSAHLPRNPKISRKSGTFLEKLQRLSYLFLSTLPRHSYSSYPYALSHSLFSGSSKIY
jgi:hypothetical protein